MNIGEKIKELMADNSNFSPAGFALALGKKTNRLITTLLKEPILTARN